MPLHPARIDHLVLTVHDLPASVRFYTALGMEHVVDGDRHALHFGSAKINLHVADQAVQPVAARPTGGSGDFCLVVDGDVQATLDALAAADLAVELGPVDRSGALGAMRSVYLRDPDGNLVELAHYPA